MKHQWMGWTLVKYATFNVVDVDWATDNTHANVVSYSVFIRIFDEREGMS